MNGKSKVCNTTPSLSNIGTKQNNAVGVLSLCREKKSKEDMKNLESINNESCM